MNILRDLSGHSGTGRLEFDYSLAGLRGTTEISQLQTALANLAAQVPNPAFHPGPATGAMNDATMVALSNALGLITKELPDFLQVTISAAMIGGATTSTAKNFVSKEAARFAIAANAAAQKYRGTGAAAPGMIAVVEPPWYQTPFGIVAILAGVFIGYKLFIAPKKGG